MLQDRYRQLLTAYVDGELSSRQRRHVDLLLRRSPEARHLLHQLQADAQLVRHLPRPALPADLSGPVLRTIVARRLKPGQRRYDKDSLAILWLRPVASWTAAAAVLLVLGGATYLFFAASLQAPEKTELAQIKASDSVPEPAPKETGRLNAKDDKQQKSSQPLTPKNDPPSSIKPPDVVPSSTREPQPKAPQDPPLPPMGKKDRNRGPTIPSLDPVADNQPKVFKIGELDRESVRKQLLAELGKDKDFRMELPCQNGTKAFERLLKAARTLHLRPIIDKQAQEPIRLKRLANYVVYLEDVTPEELVHFLRQIGAEERKSAAGKAGEEQINNLEMMRMTARDRKLLSTLVGIDPTTTGPKASEQGKATPEAGAGQGRAPRPGADKPAGKSPEHLLLVLTSSPDRSTPGSEEIKRFLEGRKPVRPGTIRVLLVLHS